jgi:hypothetical protein
VRGSGPLGVVLILAGLFLLFVLRDTLVRLIVFFLGLLGIVLGFLLIAAGVGILVGGWWFRGFGPPRKGMTSQHIATIPPKASLQYYRVSARDPFESIAELSR